MATDDDDDILDGPVPGPDSEPTASERAHAKLFADLVDKTLAGRSPPAMSADDRALLEVATVIRAASGNVELAASRRRSIVEDALRQAVGGVNPAASLGATPMRQPQKRWAPWIVAGASMAVAMAAILMLWLRPARRIPGPATAAAPVPAKTIPMEQRSRPSDALIGRIDRTQSGDASARIDTIFADRLDGYRDTIYGGLR